jgi:hypothetical protein
MMERLNETGPLKSHSVYSSSEIGKKNMAPTILRMWVDRRLPLLWVEQGMRNYWRSLKPNAMLLKLDVIS